MVQQTNILNLNNLKCECKVIGYRQSHSTLSVQLMCPNLEKLYYVNFRMVLYFSGPFSWEGSDFHLEELGKYMEIMKEIGLDKIGTTHHYNLYTVKGVSGDGGNTISKIISSSIGLSDMTPPEFL